MRLLEGHTPDTPIGDLALSADGSQLYTAGHDGTIRRWDLVRGDRELVVAGSSPCASVALSSEGDWLGWTTSTRSYLRSLKDGGQDVLIRGRSDNSWGQVRFAPSGSTVVVADRHLSAWRIWHGGALQTLRMPNDRVARTAALAFSP